MEGGGVKMNNLAATKGQKGIGGQCHPYIYIQIILADAGVRVKGIETGFPYNPVRAWFKHYSLAISMRLHLSRGYFPDRPRGLWYDFPQGIVLPRRGSSHG